MVTVAADWLIKDDTHMSMHMIIIFFHNMDNTSNIPSQQMANNQTTGMDSISRNKMSLMYML